MFLSFLFSKTFLRKKKVKNYTEMKLPRNNNNNLSVLIHRALSSNGKNGSGSSDVSNIGNDVKAIASEKATKIVDSVKQNMTSSVQFVDDTLGVTEV